MSIKIIIEHYEYDFRKEDLLCSETRQLLVDDLDSNLMDCVNSIADGESFISFHDYYKSSYDDIYYDGYFPFILKDGKYEWHVPVENVSVKDFLITHQISEEGTITIQEGIGGREGVSAEDISAIIYWIPILLNDIGMIITAQQIFKRIMPIYRKLIGKDNKSVSPYEFFEMLKSRDSWTMKELKNRTLLDEKTIECMLIQGGFKKEGNGKYIRSKAQEDDTLYEKISEISEELWGACSNTEYYCDEDDDEELEMELIDRIHDLNMLLTSLKIQSKHNKSDSFIVMSKIIEYHISCWQEYLYRGGKLQFVKPKKKLFSAAPDQLELLLYSTTNLCEYTSHLCKTMDTF